MREAASQRLASHDLLTPEGPPFGPIRHPFQPGRLFYFFLILEPNSHIRSRFFFNCAGEQSSARPSNPRLFRFSFFYIRRKFTYILAFFFNCAGERSREEEGGEDVSNITGNNYIPRKRAEPAVITALTQRRRRKIV